MKTSLLVSAALAGLVLAACGTNDLTGPSNTGVTGVRATTSFGMCLGYCRSALEITADHVVYRLFDDRTHMPPLERIAPISAAEWQSLASAVSREKVQALPAVIGCPDCADGGAESIEVLARDWTHAVTFGFRTDVPQLQPLLDRVRTVRDEQDGKLRPR